MTTQTEALKLALEALESSRVFVTSREKIKHPEGTDWYDERITAIKEALAQPEQEPVAWMQPDEVHISLWKDNYHIIPLYTTPPQRKPLSDEEMKKIWYAMQNIMGWYSFQEIARAIEAAHNIKE